MSNPSTSSGQGLQLLYICPTRALVRDLFERLQPILRETAVTIGMKTGDTSLPQQMPAILLTTPESTDSLLTRSPKTFLALQAIVIDEIHLFDNTPRGDHLRCLLPRLERIRQYQQPDRAPAQRVALSATVPDPAGVMVRYLHEGVLVQAPGGRAIEAEIRPLYNLTELVTSLAERSAFKSLLFCNSREEVEETAVFLRQQLAYHADIFVHYSNLDAAMRRDVEERFAASATAVCVCTSTLELGENIGSIDDVVLLARRLTSTHLANVLAEATAAPCKQKRCVCPNRPENGRGLRRLWGWRAARYRLQVRNKQHWIYCRPLWLKMFGHMVFGRLFWFSRFLV
ncbi:MAG: DEAD/DEAH box helicase [Chloroflexi bacterium]|nr:DEAD/DEAH box helicase [Chloroflexota bacterium]